MPGTLPRRPPPQPPTVVAVCLELRSGQLVRFALARPVALREGRERGTIRVEIHGERAWLTIND